MATAAVVDCYLQHAKANNNLEIDLEQGKLEIGIFINLLPTINALEYDIKLNSSTPIKDITLLGHLGELRLLKETLPTPDQLARINLTCEDDTFLEILMGSIKGATISFQSWAWKLSTAKKSQLVGQINNLRGDFTINANRISDLQNELNDLVNLEVKEKN